MPTLDSQAFVAVVALIGLVIVVGALLSGVVDRTGLPQLALLLAIGAALGAPGLGIVLDWDAVRAHEQLPYRKTYQPSLWHVDGAVADW